MHIAKEEAVNIERVLYARESAVSTNAEISHSLARSDG